MNEGCGGVNEPVGEEGDNCVYHDCWGNESSFFSSDDFDKSLHVSEIPISHNKGTRQDGE